MKQFEGQKILIIGATGSLGSEIAKALHGAGADLLLSGRNSKKLEALGHALSAKTLVADLNLPEDRAQLIEKAECLDGLVFAAGIAPIKPLKYLKETEFSETLALNTQQPVILLRDFIKAKKVKEGGAIVWLSSIAAQLSTPGYSMYAASKAGMEAAARCLALELAPQGIRLNCLSPGMIDTVMAQEAGEQISEAVLAKHFAEYPLGVGRAADVTGAVDFLLSPAARWITGTVLILDGGLSLKKG
jgi:NAD(P)-dependent dehydrogenase (short-subunit alcohol dehydrogenase family)